MLTGRIPDIHLNEAGREQVSRLTDRLAGLRIAIIYSSLPKRALETVRGIADRLGVEVRISQAFNEIDFGEWSGRTFEVLAQEPAWEPVQFGSPPDAPSRGNGCWKCRPGLLPSWKLCSTLIPIRLLGLSALRT